MKTFVFNNWSRSLLFGSILLCWPFEIQLFMGMDGITLPRLFPHQNSSIYIQFLCTKNLAHGNKFLKTLTFSKDSQACSRLFYFQGNPHQSSWACGSFSPHKLTESKNSLETHKINHLNITQFPHDMHHSFAIHGNSCSGCWRISKNFWMIVWTNSSKFLEKI